MQPQHSILLYVTDTLTSASFYSKVLGAEPLEISPGFAMFSLNDGTMLGLWERGGVEPKPVAKPGASEIGFHVKDKSEVDALHKAWSLKELTIIQPPGDMDFGYTFTAADPDGHRVRVFATP